MTRFRTITFAHYLDFSKGSQRNKYLSNFYTYFCNISTETYPFYYNKIYSCEIDFQTTAMFNK